MGHHGSRIGLVALAGLATMAVTPGVAAQAYFVDASMDQAYASDPLPSPFGFSVALGRTSLIGPWGLHVAWQSLSERGDSAIPQICGESACVDGPFDQSFSMRTMSVGLSYDFRNPVDVYLNLGLNAGRTRQIERLTHLDTGEETEDPTDWDHSLGGSLDLRLRPLFGPLRPAFSLRYDRIFGGSCAADAPCLPDRSVWSLSAGLSWVAPAG